MDDGEGRSPARVVDDILDDALDVAVPLGVVDGAEGGRALTVLRVRLEDGAGALPLGADDSSHLWKFISPKCTVAKRAGKGRIRGFVVVL